jgi:hypothetical protein
VPLLTWHGSDNCLVQCWALQLAVRKLWPITRQRRGCAYVQKHLTRRRDKYLTSHLRSTLGCCTESMWTCEAEDSGSDETQSAVAMPKTVGCFAARQKGRGESITGGALILRMPPCACKSAHGHKEDEFRGKVVGIGAVELGLTPQRENIESTFAPYGDIHTPFGCLSGAPILWPSFILLSITVGARCCESLCSLIRRGPMDGPSSFRACSHSGPPTSYALNKSCDSLPRNKNHVSINPPIETQPASASYRPLIPSWPSFRGSP